MRNDHAVTPKQDRKRVYDPTKRANSDLTTIDAEISLAYVVAIGFRKVANVWNNPPNLNLPDNFKLKIVDGMPTGAVGGEILSGYNLVAWLTVGTQRVNLIKLGALVIMGKRELNIFDQIKGFNPEDPENDALKVRNLAETASKFTAGNFKTRPKKKTNIIRDGKGRQAKGERKEVKAAESVENQHEGALMSSKPEWFQVARESTNFRLSR